MPAGAIGYQSYLDLLTATDLATLFSRQGGRCPITRRGFFVPPEVDLPSCREDLLLLRTRRSNPVPADELSIEPNQKKKPKYTAELNYLPWPVRVNMTENFQIGNLMLIVHFMVDAYQRIGGLQSLRELMAGLPSDQDLRKLTGADENACE